MLAIYKARRYYEIRERSETVIVKNHNRWIQKECEGVGKKMDIVCGKGLTHLLTLAKSAYFYRRIYQRKSGKRIGYWDRTQEKDAAFCSGAFLYAEIGNPADRLSKGIKCRHGPAAHTTGDNT